ncbi:MAG: hypothetical protein KME32_01780 [Mojavia pulchra JT2-VF2]|jgi:hypothetical protein|uniref:Uncharacterized protein n=1 Tax=Mojavia pulchra JT2-VF2 TaxID=287848 RepID=A0A951UDZ8_9NOST|nr:hypothetical protein [Mojavia pulchra JT2-VF2]
MKIIQALARYFPDQCGGIQVNLNELIPELRSHGIEIKIAAASNGSPLLPNPQSLIPITPYPQRGPHLPQPVLFFKASLKVTV